MHRILLGEERVCISSPLYIYLHLYGEVAASPLHICLHICGEVAALLRCVAFRRTRFISKHSMEGHHFMHSDAIGVLLWR